MESNKIYNKNYFSGDSHAATQVIDLIDTLINTPVLPAKEKKVNENQRQNIYISNPFITENLSKNPINKLTQPNLKLEHKKVENNVLKMKEHTEDHVELFGPKNRLIDPNNLILDISHNNLLYKEKNKKVIDIDDEFIPNCSDYDFIEKYDDRNMTDYITAKKKKNKLNEQNNSDHSNDAEKIDPIKIYVESNKPKIKKSNKKSDLSIELDNINSISTESLISEKDEPLDKKLEHLSSDKNLSEDPKNHIRQSDNIKKYPKNKQRNIENLDNSDEDYLADIKNITHELSKNMVNDVKDNIIQTQKYLKENKYEIMVDFLNYIVVIIDFLNRLIYQCFILLQEKIMGKGNNFVTYFSNYYNMIIDLIIKRVTNETINTLEKRIKTSSVEAKINLNRLEDKYEILTIWNQYKKCTSLSKRKTILINFFKKNNIKIKKEDLENMTLNKLIKLCKNL